MVRGTRRGHRGTPRTGAGPRVHGSCSLQRARQLSDCSGAALTLATWPAAPLSREGTASRHFPPETQSSARYSEQQFAAWANTTSRPSSWSPRLGTCPVNGALQVAASGTCLAVQRPRRHVSTAGSVGSVPGQRTKVLHAAWYGQRKEKREKENIPFRQE